MKTSIPSICFLTLSLLQPAAFPQGILTPPGAPAPTMKALDQIASTGIAINSTNTPPSAGNHFTITASGSYYLTGNYGEFNGTTNGILVAADNVTIDLNGFTMFGIGGTGIGITSSGTRNNLTIRNGIVRNWGGGGIQTEFSFYVLLEHLLVTNNGSAGGIVCGSSCIVTKCVAASNSGTGIKAGLSSVVTACSSRNNGNGGNGFSVAAGSTITTCAASNNNGTGFFLDESSSITDSTANLSHSYGINVTDRCIVRHCVATNGDSSGIVMGNYNLALANNCSFNGVGNGSYGGLAVNGNGNRIEGNTFTGNLDRGLRVTAPGNLVIANSANASGVANYTIVAGNAVGPVVAAPSSASISGNTGAGSVGSTDPHANISY